MKRSILVVVISVCLVSALAANDSPGQWIAVVAADFQEALAPLVAHRKAQGYQVLLIRPGLELQQTVRAAWQGYDGPSSVLLVGAPLPDETVGSPGCVVPALPGKQVRMTSLVCDHGYGCLEGEAAPRVAVGRFPAHSIEELQGMVAKTVAFETQSGKGRWKRRLVVFAGAPSYNPMVDQMVESLCFAYFGKLGPAWIGNVIYCNDNSCYTLPASELTGRALAYMGEGQAVTIYAGHSSAHGFWVPDFKRYRLSSKEFATMTLPEARGIFITTGCYGAQYQGRSGEGYGVHAMRNPGGPAGVIGALGEAWAAMGMFIMEGILNHLSRAEEVTTLGAVWLAAQDNLANGSMNPLTFMALNAVDGDPSISQDKQRLEAQEMFVLLGDPALRLPAFTRNLELQVPDEVVPGELFSVSVSPPENFVHSRGWVRVSRTLVSQAHDLVAVPGDLQGEERDQLLKANHERANRFKVKEETFEATGKSIQLNLELPETFPYAEVIIEVYLEGEAGDALGVRKIPVAGSPGPG